jgi:molecular chaperone DnaK (HSP70)
VKTHLPLEFVSASVLHYMKASAEKRLGEPVKDAVITVPAYFTDTQRVATVEAAKMAGLNVLNLLNEPTAAAVAYAMKMVNFQGVERVCVFDFGGGTLDVSVLHMRNGVFDVLAISGDNHLGGEDLDEILAEKILRDFEASTGSKASSDPRARAIVRSHAKMAKEALSDSFKYAVEIDSLYQGKPFSKTYSRAEFEHLAKPVLDRLKKVLQEAFDGAGIAKSNIDHILLVGGSSRIPAAQRVVSEFFDGRPVGELSHVVNPDEAVAEGAAILAYKLSGQTQQRGR